MDFKEPYRIVGANLVPKVWGGSWLSAFKGQKTCKAKIGESWEFSVHKKHPSLLRDGEGGLRPLCGLTSAQRFRLFGRAVPFLLKFIDAREDLSLQVHPPFENSVKGVGKAESWLVLGTQSSSSSGYIYMGFRPTAFSTRRRKIDFREKVTALLGRGPLCAKKDQALAAEEILPFLNRLRVKAGDVLHIPPGTLHAIGAGVRLFEIQTTSDTTYRVWDWNRPSNEGEAAGAEPLLRALHLNEAMAVLDFKARPVSYYERPSPAWVSGQGTGGRRRCLIREPNRLYALDEIVIDKKGFLPDNTAAGFCVLTSLEGDVALACGASGQTNLKTWGSFHAGETVLVPTGLSFRLSTGKRTTRILKSYIPKK